LDEKCRSYIEKAMHLVITEGTAKTTFKNFPYKDKIFGKTGTAENGKSKEFKGVEDGWFVAYTKGINRDIIVSVCIRYSGTGGGHSAKVAREILRLWIEQSLQKGGNENVSDKNV
jgi:cell division protein FtsI/penicillin-binding protein 2